MSAGLPQSEVTPRSPGACEPRKRTYEVLGTSFQVTSATLEFDAELERLLGAFEGPVATVSRRRRFSLIFDDRSRRCQLYQGPELLCSSVDSLALLNRLVGTVNAIAIGRFSGFATHAGVVTFGSEAVAYLAGSGVGKSTMVAASLSARVHYVSDEALCAEFDEHSVVPYPKPIQLSARSRQLLGFPGFDCIGSDALLTPADFGSVVASRPLEPAHIVRLVRRRGLPELREAPPREGVAWLLEGSFNHYKQPRQSFLLATELAARCRTWLLEYENAVEAVRLVAERVTRG